MLTPSHPETCRKGCIRQTVGYNVGEFVSQAINLEGKVTKGMIQEFLMRHKKLPVQKFLKKEQKLGKLFRNIIFQTFRTDEIIDENWYKLENVYLADRKTYNET
ncbi:MAG: hypothetical protein ACFFD2_30250 [Promethearchaeota archaeon]